MTNLDNSMKRYMEIYNTIADRSDNLTIDILSKELDVSTEIVCAMYEKYFYNHDFTNLILERNLIN